MPRRTAPPPDCPDTLPSVLDDVWARLATAVGSAKQPFHLPGLCTVDGAGLPSARAVVLRGVDRQTRQLFCHTDLRAPKIAHLQQQPVAAWLFYDAGARLQVRATTTVTIHTDDTLTRRRWEASELSARRCYLAPQAPGTPSDGPSPNLPLAVRDRVPTAPETEPGLAQFAVLAGRVTALDVLYLHHTGHRRAGFRWDDGAEDPCANWREP